MLVKVDPGNQLTYHKPVSGDVVWSRESRHGVREHDLEVTVTVFHDVTEITRMSGERRPQGCILWSYLC